MISCKAHGALLFSLVALVAAGCAVAPPKPELPIVRVAGLGELFEKTRNANPINDTLRGQADIRVSSLAENYRVTEFIFSKRPSYLRLETLGPLGETLLFLATDLKKVFIYSPTENRYYVGLASKKNLSLLVPLPFKAADIVELLQGRVDLARYDPVSMSFDELAGIYEMKVAPREPGRGIAYIVVDARTFSILAMRLYDDDNNLIIDGTFDDFSPAGDKTLPTSISYKVPDEGRFVKIAIEYDSVEVNTPIDDSRFVIDPPRGVQEIDLDKSIINFSRTPVR
jgi:outer membrane lipoprotein-sorting protein